MDAFWLKTFRRIEIILRFRALPAMDLRCDRVTFLAIWKFWAKCERGKFSGAMLALARL
jgi:hypothetical protein